MAQLVVHLAIDESTRMAKIDILNQVTGCTLHAVRIPGAPASASDGEDYELIGDCPNKRIRWLREPVPNYVILDVNLPEGDKDPIWKHLIPPLALVIGGAISSMTGYCSTSRSEEVDAVRDLAAEIRERKNCLSSDKPADCIRREMSRMETVEQELSTMRVRAVNARMDRAALDDIAYELSDYRFCDPKYSALDCFTGVRNVVVTWVTKSCPEPRSSDCISDLIKTHTPALPGGKP